VRPRPVCRSLLSPPCPLQAIAQLDAYNAALRRPPPAAASMAAAAVVRRAVPGPEPDDGPGGGGRAGKGRASGAGGAGGAGSGSVVARRRRAALLAAAAVVDDLVLAALAAALPAPPAGRFPGGQVPSRDTAISLTPGRPLPSTLVRRPGLCPWHLHHQRPARSFPLTWLRGEGPDPFP
jgi:hypothetical protein